MSMTDYNEVMAGAQARLSEREDVVTFAKKIREGDFGLTVQPVQNGFIVYAGPQTIVCSKPNDVGLLVRTLYGGDLDNSQITKRLRRLMGYK